MLDLLRSIPLFSGFDEAATEKVAALVKTRSFKKNAVVVTQGDDTTSVYIVIDGRLRVFRDDADGNEVILNDMQRGSWFGELAVLADSTRSASVVTLEPSQLGIISKQDLDQLLATNPMLTLSIAKFLARRVWS